MKAALNIADDAAKRMSEPRTSAKLPPCGGAVNGRDDWLREAPKVRDERSDVLLHGDHLLHWTSRLMTWKCSIARQVEACTKPPPGPRQDHDATVTVCCEIIQYSVELLDEGYVHRVELRWSIEHDLANTSRWGRYDDLRRVIVSVHPGTNVRHLTSDSVW